MFFFSTTHRLTKNQLPDVRLAYLPHLKYLDYMLIDRKAVAQAQEGYDLEGITEAVDRAPLLVFPT